MAHDLSVVEHISDRVGVMYLGKLAEWHGGKSSSQPSPPLHPSLLSAIPVPDPRRNASGLCSRVKRRRRLTRPVVVVFTRARPLAIDICKQEIPPLEEKRPGHWAACHLVDQSGNMPVLPASVR